MAKQSAVGLLLLLSLWTCGGLADETTWPLAMNSSSVKTQAARQASDSLTRTSRIIDDASVQQVGGSLAIVISVFLLVTLVMRKRPSSLPAASQLIESLGAVSLTPKVTLHVVRFGPRLLVLHLAPNAVQCVAEITDGSEVDRLLRSDDKRFDSHPQVEELLRSIQSPAVAGPT